MTCTMPGYCSIIGVLLACIELAGGQILGQEEVGDDLYTIKANWQTWLLQSNDMRTTLGWTTQYSGSLQSNGSWSDVSMSPYESPRFLLLS